MRDEYYRAKQMNQVVRAGRCIDCGVELDAERSRQFTICRACGAKRWPWLARSLSASVAPSEGTANAE
jgi:anaerobic ribonucleoside-triphosphate reductase